MADYQLSYLAITDDLGDGISGTLLNEALFDGFVDDINTEMAEVETDVENLQAATFMRGYDSVVYKYKDAATVTIQADGQFVADTHDIMWTVTANTDVGFASNLSSDVGGGEAASTLYYIWGGEDADENLEFWITDSPTSMPSELAKGTRLRGCIYNDSSSNILPFYIASDWYFYDVNVECAGSDTTEVLDTSVSTTFVDVDCSAFVPEGARQVIVRYIAGAVNWFYRVKGSTITTGQEFKADSGAGRKMPIRYPVNADGIFQTRNASSSATKCSVDGFSLN